MTTRVRRREVDRRARRPDRERRPSAALLAVSSVLFAVALLVSLLTLFVR